MKERLLDVTRDLRELTRLITSPASLSDVLVQALDALQSVVPHDLAVVLRLDGDELVVVAARGRLADARILSHRLALDAFPSIRRALETRHPVVLEEHHHRSGEGDPYAGLLDLPPGHSCMVVPLYAGDRSLGIMTFDRQVCGVYAESVLHLADVYGQVVSLALLYAEQVELLDRYRRLLQERNRVLAEEGGGACRAVQWLEAARSPAMRRLVEQAQQVAVTDVPVLIQGETGTGKEVLAQAIHCWSPRRGQPLLKLNCAAVPETLLESELFGHVRGAFSGADRDRPGRFLAASGGTLLLDEIGDLPLPAQAKLLRVLQEGTFEPLGSDRTVRVDVRILAATHRDLAAEVREGRFREDLYYRLCVFPLTVPPLRERREDILPLALSALADIARRRGRDPWRLPAATVDQLKQYSWPGNVRELVHALERATILAAGDAIPPSALRLLPAGEERAETTAPRAAIGGEGDGEILPLAEMERRYLERVLRHTGGRIYGAGGAAELLGLPPTTLQSRLKRLGVDRRRIVREGGSPARDRERG